MASDFFSTRPEHQSHPDQIWQKADINRYAKRKREQETASAALRTAKTLKANQAMNDREMVFGDVIRQDTGKKAMSPRVSLSADRPIHDGNTPGIGETGMGVKDEAMGNVLGGEGLVEVGAGLDET